MFLCMFKQNEAKSTHAEPTTKWFDRAPQLMSYPSKRHNYKRGKSSMITTDNMHQGYIFRVCSVVLLLVQCCRFCYVISFACFTSHTFLRVRGQEGEYVPALLCCCSCPLCACKGAWGELEYCEENSYFTLDSNLSFIYIYQIHLKKSKYSNEPKNTLHLLFWLAAKHNEPVDSPFHCPAAHAAAGQGDAWCLQGMAI